MSGIPVDTERSTRTAALIAIAFLLMTVGACGRAGEPANYSESNANNPPMNSANSTSNTTTNATANTQQTANAGPQSGGVVDEEMLRDALRDRLRHDNEHFMPVNEWESDAWLDVNVGAFYKNDDETAKLMVCDITEKLLQPLNKRLKPFARQKLYDGVTSSTKCRNAVNLMFRATLNSTAIQPVP